jgi:alpha-glucoside transport system substrate-binding protein
MHVYDRKQRDEIDQLVEDFTQHGLSRRAFIQRGLALGLSFGAVGSLLAACGGSTTSSSNSTPKSVDVLNVWTGEEQDSFRAVIYPWSVQTGITVNIESTRDLNTALTTRIQGHNPPDIAILPNPGKMQQLAMQNHLVPLDNYLDMNQIQQEYSKGWIDLGSYNGHLYAIFYKAANKGTVWYNPKQFTANSYQIPSTWQDMITLSNTIASSGKFPWSMGTSAGSASGWPAADWIAQIYLNLNGGDMYDKWVAHQIPWTDNSIKEAFQMFGQIVGGNHYINGAPQSILALDPQTASYKPFSDPPGAYMYYLGDFTEGFIHNQFPSLVPGTDFNFFPFPSINAQYAGAVTGGADLVTALKDNEAVKMLVQYLSTAAAQEIWVKRGGFTATNKQVDLNAYPDAVAQASAKQLTSAPLYRFGADDLMPQAVENAFWMATLNFISDQSQLDSILNNVEGIAQQAYANQ